MGKSRSNASRVYSHATRENQQLQRAYAPSLTPKLPRHGATLFRYNLARTWDDGLLGESVRSFQPHPRRDETSFLDHQVTPVGELAVPTLSGEMVIVLFVKNAVEGVV